MRTFASCATTRSMARRSAPSRTIRPPSCAGSSSRRVPAIRSTPGFPWKPSGSPRSGRSRCSASASGCSPWPRRSGRRSSGRPTLVHGEATEMTHDGAGLLEGMPPAFMGPGTTRSRVDPATLPPELRVTAMSEVDRVVMGIRHVTLPLEGRPVPPRIRADSRGSASARQFPPPGRGGRGVAARRRQRNVRHGRDAGNRRAAGTAPDERPGPRRPAPRSSTAAPSPFEDARGAMGAVMDGEATPLSWRRC